jgi:tetratricopeptide repeat protein
MTENPRDPGVEGHLSAEELAVLAEGGSRDRLPPAVLEHLSQCRSCMSAYADLVRYRAGWLAFPEAFRGGHRVPSSRSTWPAVAAAVIIVAGITAALLIGRARSRPDVGPITALIERASAEGLVIPGGEAGAATTSPQYRSEAVVDGDAEQALEQLRVDYEHHARTDANARRLAAALVAAGQLDLAGNYIAEGLSRSPGDARLMTLAGIVAYQSGDPALAERRLQGALSASPGDLTAMLDLGLVVAHARGLEQAGLYLNGVIEQAPHSPLAARARAALADHGRP